MSSGGGYQGGRTRMGTKVFVNVYDLSPSNEYLYPIGLGFYHSGVEFLGTEYSFGSGAGVFDGTPKEAAPGFRESIEIGTFEGDQADFRRIYDELKELHFSSGEDYNLLKKNCNHFSNSLVYQLIPGQLIPPYINRASEMAMCCSCLLPKEMLEGPGSAPVNGGGGATAGNRSSSSNNRSASTKIAAFAGQGARLGGTTTSSSSAGGESEGLLGKVMGGISGVIPPSSNSMTSRTEENLTDRREKARKAAMARFERQERSSSNSPPQNQ